MDVVGMIEAAVGGNQRVLGKVVSHVADGDSEAFDLLHELYPRGGHASIVGVTGAPGAGKSTLVSGLIPHLRQASPSDPMQKLAGHESPASVAVVAVDPSSPFTGGAILGDRIRMGDHAGDPHVYIRSVANRGHLGGITSSTPAVVAALDGLGFGEIIVETVGVGQAEVEIASVADTTVVVVTPGWGDGVQAAKAGFLEIADIFVVNKADREGSADTAAELQTMLDIGPIRPWTPPIVKTIATDGEGLGTLMESITLHREHLAESGELGERVRARARHALVGALRDRVEHSVGAVGDDVIDEIVDRHTDPWTVARSIVPG